MLESLLPTVQSIIATKAKEFAKGEGPKTIFKGVYTLLPGAVRLVVKEESFVEFCLNHQGHLLGENQKNIKKKATTKKKPIAKGSSAKKK